MLTQIVLLLLDTACGFLALAWLARFALQWARVPFGQPLGHFVIAVTDWAVRPIRRVVPGLFGFDLACLLLAWASQVIYLLVAVLLTGQSPSPVLLAVALVETARLAVYLAMAVVIVAALFSWINPYAPMAGVFDALGRPLLRPFRRFIPPLGGVDLSPLALLLLLQVVLLVLDRARRAFWLLS